MSEIPSHKKKLLERKWVVELISAGPPVLGALVGAYLTFLNPVTSSASGWLFFVAVWLIGASIVRIRQAAIEEDKKSGKDALYAALLVVRATVVPDDKDVNVLRVALHRVLKPHNDPEHIEQVTPYVGGDGGEPGRKFSIKAGVAGKAARVGEPRGINFPAALSIDERVNILKNDWGYTDEAARVIVGKNRLSFLSVPIFGKGSRHPIGVVYFDSTREGIFDAVNSRLIINACKGVASYISEKYL